MFANLFHSGIANQSDEYALTPAKKQIGKHWTAAVIDTGNLAIGDGTFNAKRFGNPPSEFCKAERSLQRMEKTRVSCSAAPVRLLNDGCNKKTAEQSAVFLYAFVPDCAVPGIRWKLWIRYMH